MKKPWMKWAVVMGLTVFVMANTYAQGSDAYGQGMKVKLDESGNKYFRLILWNQIWTRVVEQNPGSMVNGVPQNHTWDVGARRLRMMAYAQLGPRYLIMAHIGVNNQTFASGGASGSSGTGGNGAGKKPGLFFHDAYNEYAVLPNIKSSGENRTFSMYIGAGLHNWYGLARQSSASTQNILTIDLPLINFPLSDFADQFNRQFGIYAKGRIGKATYRVSMDKPFATNLQPVFDSIRGQVAVDNNGQSKPAFQGYFDYQFWDQEADLLPFRVGSYVGTKRVLNIGAGFYHQPHATRSLNAAGETIHHPINLLAADVFADFPFGNVENNMALTFLGSFYHFDFGPNYVRTLGVMNNSLAWDPDFPAGSRSMNGLGNARFFVGTGQLFYANAGLLLPKKISSKIRLQPFGAYTYKKLEYLGTDGHYIDLGANIFIDGHQAKLTPQWSLRPLYFQESSASVQRGFASEYMLQFQICL